ACLVHRSFESVSNLCPSSGNQRYRQPAFLDQATQARQELVGHLRLRAGSANREGQSERVYALPPEGGRETPAPDRGRGVRGTVPMDPGEPTSWRGVDEESKAPGLPATPAAAESRSW